ncbi:CBS domain-containing protein [Terrilactibacillus laevilacticus]|uniref:CBS domain-containing protein n=1 Tax=Terrilactibacillus laevilacticus TaxID=1380157 RepID=A0ABW5PS22_9BACI|nr:CBS domain-containing protein [Terrilactibacillus laevilacticus]
MFVKQVMIPKMKVTYAKTSTSLKVILNTFDDQKIDGIPVVSNDGKQYIGLLTKNRIYEAAFDSEEPRKVFVESKTAGDIVVQDSNVLTVNDVFEKALVALKDRPIAVVVGQKKEFLGIVTRFDILETFQSAFGMQKSGVRISLTSNDAKGRMAKIADFAKQCHINIISFATFDETDKLVRRMVLKIEKSKSLQSFLDKLEKTGFRILDLHED